jgi:hypothetical protein
MQLAHRRKLSNAGLQVLLAATNRVRIAEWLSTDFPWLNTLRGRFRPTTEFSGRLP